MNNSVFGKLMEDVRRHADIQLITSEKKLLKYAARPQYKRHVIFHKDLVGVELVKKIVVLNKPIYAGFAVLDVSKTLMYSFHYDVIKEKYGSNATLLFTDTDSLCYHIQTPDLYADMALMRDHFDTSDYPTDHPLFSTANKKVIGKFKDECNGVPPLEFVGLRSKMYSLLVAPDTAKQTMKGVPSRLLHKHDHYKTCLFQNSCMYDTFYTIHSNKHIVHTQQITKKSLSSFDDKRYILDDGISSVPYS